MKIRFVFITAIAVVMAMPAIPPAHSCTCAPPPPPAQAFQEAAAVLMGKVISVGDGPGPNSVTAMLQVSRIWKGEKNFLQQIVTTGGAMYGFYFQTGKTYDLVYLSSLPGAANDSACCGSKNILAGDLYLFLGMIVYLLRRKSKEATNSRPASR